MTDYQEEIGDVLYAYGRGLYANITNKCPCKCSFCIRDMTDSLGNADSLWLKREPSVEEVIDMIENTDLSSYDELVFCGYGEPMVRLDDLLHIAQYVKKNTNLKIRINTNGLSDLINRKETAPMLKGIVDSISISLNQSDSKKYMELCHPAFGDKAYPAILKFTEEAKKYVPNVAMSIVNVISSDDVKKCQDIAKKMGLHLRIR